MDLWVYYSDHPLNWGLKVHYLGHKSVHIIRPTIWISDTRMYVIQTLILFYRCRKRSQVSSKVAVPRQRNSSRCVQRGSEIQTSLDLEWSKRGWVANGFDFELYLKFGSHPFEIRQMAQMATILPKTIWNLDKIVLITSFLMKRQSHWFYSMEYWRNWWHI